MITGRDCLSCGRVNKFVFNSYNQFQSQSNNESSDNFLKVCDSQFCTTELEDAFSPLSIASSRGRRSSEESSATTLMKYCDGTASETPVSLASPILPFDLLKANGKYVSKVLIRLQSKTPQPKSHEQQASPDIDIDSGRSSATESMSDADTYLAWPARLISDNKLEVYGGSPSIRVECIKTEPAPPPPFSECHGVLSSMCLSSAKLPLPVPSGLFSTNQTTCLERDVREEKAEALHLEYPVCEDCETSKMHETELPHFEAKPFHRRSRNSRTSDSQGSSLALPTSAFAENAHPPPQKARVKRFVSMLEVKIPSSDLQIRRSVSTDICFSKFPRGRRMNAFASASKIQLYSSGCYLTSPLNVSGSQTINHSGSNSIESCGQTKTQPVDDKSQKSTSPKLRGLTSGLAVREDEKVERHGTPGRNDSNGTPTLGQSIQLRRLCGQQEVTGARTFKRSDGFDHRPTTPDGEKCGVRTPVYAEQISKTGRQIPLQGPDFYCFNQNEELNLQHGPLCSQIPASLLDGGKQKRANTVRSLTQLYLTGDKLELFGEIGNPTKVEHTSCSPKLASRPLSPRVLDPENAVLLNDSPVPSSEEKLGSRQPQSSQNSPRMSPATRMSPVRKYVFSNISKASEVLQSTKSPSPSQRPINVSSQNPPLANISSGRTHDDLRLYTKMTRNHRVPSQKGSHSSASLSDDGLLKSSVFTRRIWPASSNRCLLFNQQQFSENVSHVKTERDLLINRSLGIGRSPLGDSPSSAIGYQLLDVASKMAIRKFTHLALPTTGPDGPLSSKEGMRSLIPASDLSSSPNKMTKMFVGSLQLVGEVPGILPFERACISLLPFWHGDGDGILSTYQVPPRRYSLRVSGGRASRLRNQKDLLHRSHEKPILTPDLEGTSISVAPQSDGSPVRATVAVTCRTASENKCRWTAAPKIRRGSHVFMSDLWPEIIQRRDCERNSAGCLQGYSCKLFSLDSEKQEASERLVGVKATGAPPTIQRQFMVDATGLVDSTLTPEITESLYLMPMRASAPPKHFIGADVGEQKSLARDNSGGTDSRQPRNQVKWATNTGQNMDGDEYEDASSYYVVEDARARRSSSATLADSVYQSYLPKWLDLRRGRSQSLPQRRKSCLSRRAKNASEMSLLESLRSKETELRELLERCKSLKTEIKKTSKLCRQHKTHLSGRPDIEYGFTDDDCLDTLSLHPPRGYYSRKSSSRHHRHKHSSEHRSGRQPNNYVSPQPPISSVRFQNQYDSQLKACLFSSPSLSSIGMPSAYPASTSPIYSRFAATSPVPIIMPPTYTAQVHMPLPAFAHTDPRFAAYGGGGYGGFGITGGGGAGEYLHQPSGTLRPPPISNYWHPGMPPPFGYARHSSRCCFSRHCSRSGSYKHRSKSSRHVSLRHHKSSHAHQHHRRRSESEGPSLRKSRDRQEKFRDNGLYHYNYEVPFSGDTGSPSFHNFGHASKEPEKSPPVASTTDFCYAPMCGDSIPQPCKPPSGDSLLPKGTYNLSAIGTSNPFKGHSIPNESPNQSFTQNPPSLSPSLAQVKPVIQAPPMNYGRPNEQAPGIAIPPTIAGRLPVTYRPIQAMSPRPMNNSCPPPPQQSPQKPQQQFQSQQQFHTQGPLNPNLQQLPIKTLPARRMANLNAQPRPHLSAMFSNEGRQQQQQPPRPPMQQQTEGAQSLQPAPMVGIAPPPALPSVPNIGTTGPQFGLYRLPANKGEYVQLEKRYDWLQQEKSRLESDLSKLPLRGKVPNRGNVTIEEDRLNQNLKRIDREISALRLIMKKYQSNLASQRTELSKTKLL